LSVVARVGHCRHKGCGFRQVEVADANGSKVGMVSRLLDLRCDYFADLLFVIDESSSADRHAQAGVLRKYPLDLDGEDSYAGGSTNSYRVFQIIDRRMFMADSGRPCLRPLAHREEIGVQATASLRWPVQRSNVRTTIRSTGERRGFLGKKHDLADASLGPVLAVEAALSFQHEVQLVSGHGREAEVHSQFSVVLHKGEASARSNLRKKVIRLPI